MTATDGMPDASRYARCIKSSKRVYWDIDEDIIRGRRFDAAHKFLPDGLSLVDTFTTLSPDERRFVSQIQGRTYANIFGLVERFINAKISAGIKKAVTLHALRHSFATHPAEAKESPSPSFSGPGR